MRPDELPLVSNLPVVRAPLPPARCVNLNRPDSGAPPTAPADIDTGGIRNSSSSSGQVRHGMDEAENAPAIGIFRTNSHTFYFSTLVYPRLPYKSSAFSLCHSPVFFRLQPARARNHDLYCPSEARPTLRSKLAVTIEPRPVPPRNYRPRCHQEQPRWCRNSSFQPN